MNGIVIDGISKMWTRTAGLAPISFDVAPGELVALRGRSGSGKSTLLAVLAGLCSPDTGVATLDGHRPDPALPWSILALVPQVLGLSVELSIAENVADALAGTTTGSDIRSHALDAALAVLDLDDQAQRPIDEVSMGQQQRAAIARAIVASPSVLLGDEPTSFQDAAHAAAVVATFRRHARDGAAVLVVTHDPIVADAADRVIELAPPGAADR